MSVNTQLITNAISSCSSSLPVKQLVPSPPFLAIISIVIILSFVLNLFFHHNRTHAYIRDLFIYPIKGCAGIRVASATVTPRGLANDRMLMIVRDSDGAFQTQRQLPRMATIRPMWNESGHLVLTAPSRPDFVLEPSAEGQVSQRRSAHVWKHTVPDAIDCGDAVADWLSETLSVPCLRLVRMPDDHARPVKNAENPASVVSFADGYPLLLASEKSREAVRKHAGLSKLSMTRFRPNVVMDGPRLVDFEEHRWRKVALGEVVFEAPVECERCQVPRIDPSSGTPNSLPDGQPTTALKSLTNNHFGVNLVPVVPADGSFSLRVGDRVRLIKKAR